MDAAEPRASLPYAGRPFSPRNEAVKRFLSPFLRPLGSVLQVRTREPIVALTFDDGPDPMWTPRLLDLLRGRAAATFFVVGKSAREFPEIVERMRVEGHSLANHSWDHPSIPLLAPQQRRAQIERCAKQIGLDLQGGPLLFRPPYGHQTYSSFVDTRRAGHQPVMWTVLMEDWLPLDPELLARQVERRLAPGSIVLAHDALYTAHDPQVRDRTRMLQAVELLLDRWSGRYRFVSLHELLARGRAIYWPDFRKPNLEWLARVS